VIALKLLHHDPTKTQNICWQYDHIYR